MKEHGCSKTEDLVREITDLKRKLKATKEELSATKKHLKRREKNIQSLTEELEKMKFISGDQKKILIETYLSTFNWGKRSLFYMFTFYGKTCTKKK